MRKVHLKPQSRPAPTSCRGRGPNPTGTSSSHKSLLAATHGPVVRALTSSRPVGRCPCFNVAGPRHAGAWPVLVASASIYKASSGAPFHTRRFVTGSIALRASNKDQGIGQTSSMADDLTSNDRSAVRAATGESGEVDQPNSPAIQSHDAYLHQNSASKEDAGRELETEHVPSSSDPLSPQPAPPASVQPPPQPPIEDSHRTQRSNLTNEWIADQEAIQPPSQASIIGQHQSVNASQYEASQARVSTSTSPFGHDSSGASSIQHVVGQSLHVDSYAASRDDLDSALGDDDRLSSTASLTSSVLDYRYNHGRRYHAFNEDAYHLPNDEQEIDRLDIQHSMWALTLNRALHISPLPQDIQHCLDVGTGTGKWAIEFADAHPQVQVVGTDLSPIQPIWMPPNCQFIVDNAEQEWIFGQRFDFVHSRMLLMGIHDWSRYFTQAWNNVKPGGWVEVQEVQFPIAFADDGSVPPDAPLLVWSQRVREAALKAGIDTLVSNRFRDMLQAQGFVNVKEKWPKWALGAWPKGQQEKQIGVLTLENTKSFVSAIAMKLWTTYLDWSPEAVELELVNVRKDLEDRKKHYYWQMAIFAAQKPHSAD